MLTITQQLKRQGRREERLRMQQERQHTQDELGRMQKELERAQEETRQFLRMVLESRFGPASDTVSERIARARDEDISDWMQRALHAVSLEDVFAPT